MTAIVGGRGFQTNYRDRAKQGRVGLFKNVILDQTYQNVADDVAKVAVLTLTSASGDQVITIEGNSLTVPFNTGDNQTASDIADAINQTFNVGVDLTVPSGQSASNVEAAAAGSVITITGRYGGYDFNIAYSGTGGVLVQNGTGGSVLATQSSSIEFGLWVGFNAADVTGWNHVNDLPCRTPDSASTTILGIAGGSTIQPNVEGSIIPAYLRGASVATMRRGWAITQIEDTGSVIPGGDVFYRHTANGSLTKRGISATASGTGLAQKVGARFETTAFVVDGVRCAWISNY